MNNTDGRLWARWTLGISLLISVVGNVTHAVLATSDISLWLRVPGAVIWPVLAFLGIEIIVRVIWRRTLSHRFARLMVLWPIVPAAITSYEHLHALLLLMGERPFIAMIGPGAIDGAMVGCTLVLLFTRVLPAPESLSVDDLMEKWAVEEAPISPAPMEHLAVLQEDLSTDQVRELENIPERSSRARSSWDARQVAEMILAGAKTPEIAEKTGAGNASIGRFRKVIRMVQAEPRMPIDPAKEKVTSDNVRMIRELVSL
jgi:hypothetical protein